MNATVKMEPLHGKAAVIGGHEMDRAMSKFSLPGPLLPIEEITEEEVVNGTLVKVVFSGADLVVSVTFSKVVTIFGRKVIDVNTRYRGEIMPSNCEW